MTPAPTAPQHTPYTPPVRTVHREGHERFWFDAPETPDAEGRYVCCCFDGEDYVTDRTELTQADAVREAQAWRAQAYASGNVEVVKPDMRWIRRFVDPTEP